MRLEPANGNNSKRHFRTTGPAQLAPQIYTVEGDACSTATISSSTKWVVPHVDSVVINEKGRKLRGEERMRKKGPGQVGDENSEISAGDGVSGLWLRTWV